MNSACIWGTGAALPEKVITNFDLEKMVETTDEWITTRTGIKERRQAAPHQTTSSLSVQASRKALEMAGVSPSDLNLIICSTISPDMPLPSTAAFIQTALGAPSCCSFDLAAACSGFLFGMTVADQFIKTNKAKHVLVIGAELLSRYLDYQDRATCVIFGDGAGAVILEPADDALGVIDFLHEMDGSGGCALFMPGGGSLNPATHETVDQKMHYVHQDGQAVFKFAVRKMAELCEKLLERNGLSGKDVDLFIPHQANRRIISATADRLGMPMEKVIIDIDRYGNTTSATIPLAMSTAREEGKLKKGDLVLLAAVGAGFTVGTTLLRWAY